MEEEPNPSASQGEATSAPPASALATERDGSKATLGDKTAGAKESEAVRGVVSSAEGDEAKIGSNSEGKDSTEAKSNDEGTEEGDDKGDATAPPKKEDDAEPGEEEKEEAQSPSAKGRQSRKSKADAAATTPKRSAEEAGASREGGGSTGGREKRARKASQTYKPEDFTKVDHSVAIVPGRGVKLETLAAVRESIEHQCHKQPHRAEAAHKFVFGGQRKPPKADIQPNLLAFSGYLPPKPEGMDEKELEKMDKKVEAKMGERAFKLKVVEIKELCDFFALDRSGITSKEDLIDCLLDFLGEPSDERVKEAKDGPGKVKLLPPKGSKKKRASKGGQGAAKASKKQGKSKTKKKDESSDESESEVDDDDNNQDEEGSSGSAADGKDDGIDLQQVKKGQVPNDVTLRKWVKCFVQCYDLEKASVKVALEVAGEKFGVDLAEKKDLLKQMLTEAMT